MTHDPREVEAARARFTRRAVLLGLGQTALFGALGLRLYQLQMIEGAGTAERAFDNRTRQLAILPRRGRILDASGTVLATNREAFRAVLAPERGASLAELRAMLSAVAPLIGLSGKDQERLALRAARPGGQEPIVLSDNLSFEQVAALQVRNREFPAVAAQTVWARTYPMPGRREAVAMAHIVGTVGAVERRALDDDALLRSPDARIGKSGVEAGMDVALRGIAGSATIEVDARGRRVRHLSETPPREGADVALTIDTPLQAAVMDLLAEAGHTGAVVAMDVATGDVLALASTPSFDPAGLSGPGSRAAWQAVTANATRPLLNRAIAGQYPPGSTFKLVTALAALEKGHITAKEKIECWGDVTYAGHTFRCWNRKGHIQSDLHKALRESCDCYFYEAARRTGMETIAAMAKELGLGQTYEAGIAQQKAGLIPSPAWKRFRARTGWLIGETVLSGIGQGYVLATPLQLAVMTARVATGRAVTPTLIKRPDGDPPPVFADLAVSPAALAAVRRGMVAVVNEPGGTGQSADLDDPGTIVAGKTGTSQVSRLSAERDRTVALKAAERDHAVFVAFVPAEAPRYAVSVLLEHAGGGGAQAAPFAREVIKLLLDRPAGPAAAAEQSAERRVPG